MRAYASGRAPKRIPSKPTAARRWAMFAVGLVVGGVIGYGLRTSGPGEEIALFSLAMAPWVLVPAVAVGALAAHFPDAAWRARRLRVRVRHDDD